MIRHLHHIVDKTTIQEHPRPNKRLVYRNRVTEEQEDYLPSYHLWLGSPTDTNFGTEMAGHVSLRKNVICKIDDGAELVPKGTLHRGLKTSFV
jgi:hypothetical protein